MPDFASCLQGLSNNLLLRATNKIVVEIRDICDMVNNISRKHTLQNSHRYQWMGTKRRWTRLENHWKASESMLQLTSIQTSWSKLFINELQANLVAKQGGWGWAIVSFPNPIALGRGGGAAGKICGEYQDRWSPIVSCWCNRFRNKYIVMLVLHTDCVFYPPFAKCNEKNLYYVKPVVYILPKNWFFYKSLFGDMIFL